MLAEIIYLSIAAGLFAVSFITKRRFGMLGLALAAGSIISATWGYDFGLTVAVFGLPTNNYSSAFVSSVLLLLPAGLLLMQGCKYKSLPGRVIGSTLFVILALAFLVEPLSQTFIPNSFGQTAYSWFAANRSIIIALGLTLAVVDLLLKKFVKSDKHDKHRKHS